MTSRSTYILLGTVAVAVVAMVAVLVVWPPFGSEQRTPTVQLYVDPTGSDTNDGSASAPLRTIQAGLAKATPGTQITLAPGCTASS